MKTRLICPSFERYKTVSAMVGTARCAVPARVVAGGTNDRVAPAIRKSCAAARGADIAARCPYHAPHTEGRGNNQTRLSQLPKRLDTPTDGERFSLSHPMGEGRGEGECVSKSEVA